MSLIPFWKKAWNTWKFLQEIRRQRNELLKLDERMLNDIGVSRVDAEREAKRPFWDVVGVKDDSLRERNPPKASKAESGEKFSGGGSPGSFRGERTEWGCCERSK